MVKTLNDNVWMRILFNCYQSNCKKTKKSLHIIGSSYRESKIKFSWSHINIAYNFIMLLLGLIVSIITLYNYLSMIQIKGTNYLNIDWIFF